MSTAEQPSVTVFGAGSWGTALAVSLAATHDDVTLWARRPEAVEKMKRERHNPKYLPEVDLPSNLKLSSNLEEAAHSDFWVIATPSQAVRDMARVLEPFAGPEKTIISVAKGIENETLMTTTQVIRDVLGMVPPERIGVLYGPSHAEEVARHKPTTVVASAPSDEVTREIQDLFMAPHLRVYWNADLLGVEIAGSVKNVLALAAGISDGLGYGDNTKAAIVTRGIAEIKRLGLAMGADAMTFSGLAGIGDVVVTCMSGHSRNRYFGEQIGKGKSLEEVEESMQMVAEGVKTVVSVRDLAEQYGIEMPITEAVHATLYEGVDPTDAVEELMTRDAKREGWLPDVLVEE